ncbi:MAG: hypothetical protein QME81_02405 [bacterium]|nr:hypothetical protein [bacterium]
MLAKVTGKDQIRGQSHQDFNHSADLDAAEKVLSQERKEDIAFESSKEVLAFLQKRMKR